MLVTERSRQHGERQRIETCSPALKRVLGLGETLAKTLWWAWPRGVRGEDLCAYTYAFLVNRLLGRPQGHIKELWA